MRVLFFTTCTSNNQCFAGSFLCLGHDTEVIQYDVHGFNIAEVVEAKKPDLCIYIGALGWCHINRHVPDADLLARANKAAPMVLICCDSGDAPWWPTLEEYHVKNSFRLQVSIDGCKDSPIAKYGRVALTPVDPAQFPKIDWEKRDLKLGFAGGFGCRSDMLNYLTGRGELEWFSGSPNRPYEEMCMFYTRCRAIVNSAKTGSGQRWHVKGRVIEAGLAGAVLIESAEAPTKDWFEPGRDYLTWSQFEDIVNLANRTDPEMQAIAQRFHDRVLQEHSAQAFWGNVFKDIGLQ